MSGRDKKIPILMYHEIYRADEVDHLKGLTNPAYNTELDRFRRQMEWIYAAKMRTLTIDELLMDGPSAGRPAICLTFDDGWSGNYSNAYPVLKEYGFKATFFIATELIGRPFYMNWEHLKEMAVNGMSIQSHTVTHRPLGGLQEREISFELSESKKAIEEKLGSRVNHLSLPHGSKNARVLLLAKEIGYTSISTSDVGFQTPENNGPCLKRINMGDGMSEKRFHFIVEGKNHAVWGMVIAKSLKNILRGTIRVNTYRKLYQWIYGIR